MLVGKVGRLGPGVPPLCASPTISNCGGALGVGPSDDCLGFHMKQEESTDITEIG
ncbi:hypothetical protein H4R20_000749 [Coemansia guatemalensis]|uniref:Uncharacterized protein n=1 Tax=Coemansia guatemalensis TaxID=2761395 RepID=A0A9W8I5P6_9FUNG|nr:hypothetical protein H4R20_000749 [Coemansia guatemalensis]